jgi:hypothetical protein
MKLPKEKTAYAARKTKRRLENPLTKAQKDEKVAAMAERQQKIQRTADENREMLIAMVERRSTVGVEGLGADATGYKLVGRAIR